MAQLAGVWGPQTATGSMPLEVDGLAFDVPVGTVKIVNTSAGTVAHVRAGGEAGHVYVFSRHGQLQEVEAEAHSRALKSNWANVPA